MRRRRRGDIAARTDLFGNVRPRDLPDTGETPFHRSVLEYLCLVLPPDYLVIHVPNGGADPVHRGKSAYLGAKAGAPDLFIFGERRAWAFECKSKTGVRSEDQIKMHKALDAAGIPHATVRTIETVEMMLKSWGIPLRGKIAA